MRRNGIAVTAVHVQALVSEILFEACTSMNRWKSRAIKSRSARRITARYGVQGCDSSSPALRHRVPAPRDWCQIPHHSHKMPRPDLNGFSRMFGMSIRNVMESTSV